MFFKRQHTQVRGLRRVVYMTYVFVHTTGRRQAKWGGGGQIISKSWICLESKSVTSHRCRHYSLLFLLATSSFLSRTIEGLLVELQEPSISPPRSLTELQKIIAADHKMCRISLSSKGSRICITRNYGPPGLRCSLRLRGE